MVVLILFWGGRCADIGGGGMNIRIDDPNHTTLAMRILGTIVPNGLGIVDHNRIRRHHGISGFDGHVPREQAFVHGHAGGVEGGLDDGVVL